MKRKIFLSVAIVMLVLAFSPLSTTSLNFKCLSGDSSVNCPPNVSIIQNSLGAVPSVFLGPDIARAQYANPSIKVQRFDINSIIFDVKPAKLSVYDPTSSKYYYFSDEGYFLYEGDSQITDAIVTLNHSLEEKDFVFVLKTAMKVYDLFGVSLFEVKNNSLVFSLKNMNVVFPLYSENPEALIGRLLVVFSQLNEAVAKTTIGTQAQSMVVPNELDFRYRDTILR